MKRIIILLAVCLLLGCLGGCAEAQTGGIAATTLPVYEFTARLCQGTGIPVTCLVTENVSCLHDYTLKVDQMKLLESADAVVISGVGLEEFMEDALSKVHHIVVASSGVDLIDCADQIERGQSAKEEYTIRRDHPRDG